MSRQPDVTDRQRFYAIRRRWMRAKQAEQTYRTRRFWPRYRQLDPPRSWLTPGEARQLERFADRRSAVSDEFFELLAEIGGRSWTTGVPHWWVMEELTYEDAVTTGELATIPPPAYGSTEHDVMCFAGAVSAT